MVYANYKGVVEGAEGAQVIKACRWMKKNSVSELDKEFPDNVNCEVRMIKGYGPPEFFDLSTALAPSTLASTLAPTPALVVQSAPVPIPIAPIPVPFEAARAPALLPEWREVLVGWKNSKGQLVPGSAKFALTKKSKEVTNLPYEKLRTAMLHANVKGVAKATNKDDLIMLMCKFNCTYRSSDPCGIYLAPKCLGAATAADTSSSDSDDPVSKGARALAVASAAAAKEHTPAALQQRALHTVDIMAKRKAAEAPVHLSCTGTPKNDPLCGCDFCFSMPPPRAPLPRKK